MFIVKEVMKLVCAKLEEEKKKEQGKMEADHLWWGTMKQAA